MESCSKIRIFPAPPSWFFFLLGFLISVLVAGKSYSQQPVVGRKAADKYFNNNYKVPQNLPQKFAVEDKSVNVDTRIIEDEPVDPKKTPEYAEHFMAVYVGALFGGNSFAWGNTGKVEGPGSVTAGVAYRIGEWANFTDLLLRIEILTYDLPEGEPVKISFSTGIQFPEASSGFPLYFGAGIGAGIFAKQVSEESVLSLDYQLLLGARMFNVFDSTGLFVEAGLKNHFLLLSDGQYNGFFASVGTVFTF